MFIFLCFYFLFVSVCCWYRCRSCFLVFFKKKKTKSIIWIKLKKWNANRIAMNGSVLVLSLTHAAHTINSFLKRNNRCLRLPFVYSYPFGLYSRRRHCCYRSCCYCVDRACVACHKWMASTTTRHVALTNGQNLHLVLRQRRCVDVRCPAQIRWPIAVEIAAVIVTTVQILYLMVQRHRRIPHHRHIHLRLRPDPPVSVGTFGMTRSNLSSVYCYC